MTRSVLTVAVAVIALTTAPGVASGARPAKPYDFDGDGRQEIVAGVPGWTIEGAPNAGAVFVFRGARAMPFAITADTPGVPGRAEGDDLWGAAIASADFDRDGYADLAVAAPGERAVVVLPGSRGGLAGARGRSIGRDGPLVAGDLSGDGYGDLAVGAPNDRYLRDEDYGSGALRVFLGGVHGLRRRATRVVSRPDRQDADFGSVMALGDIDGDGYRDLVEGAPGSTDDVDEGGVPGHVSFCRGTPTGPTLCRSIAPSLPGGPTSLAVGDVTCDGQPDVIAGVPSNRFVSEDDPEPSGAVYVWRGSRSGPQSPRMTITQASAGLSHPAERAAGFGASVDVARLDGDRCADIAVGTPGHDRSAGRVTLVRGDPRRFSTMRPRVLVQGRAGLPGPAGAGHEFGAAVELLDIDGDERSDLVVGAPGARSLTLVAGARGGLRLSGSRRLPFAIPTPADPPDMAAPLGAILGR